MRGLILFTFIFIHSLFSQELIPIIPHPSGVKAIKAEGNFSPFLFDLIQEMKNNPQFAIQLQENSSSKTIRSLIYQIDSENRIFTRIKCSADFRNVLDQLKQYNANIAAYNEKLGLIDCWLSTEQIETLAQNPSIRNISECERGFVRTGSVTSEGDTIHKTDIIRQYLNAAGNGIKVGVISDGVDDIASSQATDDLPSAVNVLDNSYGGNEGTAMLEIINDLAPGAELYFSQGVTSSLAFINSVNNLIDASCDIIVDDIGYFGEPSFEEGPIASAVRDVISKNGIVYASSAGNSQDEHYEGDYSPVIPSPPLSTSISEAHDFGGGDYGQQITLDENQTFYIFIQWNEPFGSVSSDYTLHLVNSAMTTRYNIAASQPDLTEPFVYIAASGGPTTFNLVIEKLSGSNRRVEVTYNFGGYATVDEYNNLPGSISGQPAVNDVIAAGAVRYNSPNSIEYFSSIGPSRIYSYPSYSYEDRNKPDVVAVDGNIITGAGGFGQEYPPGSGDIRFFGTSAAAPHVAACAAALWSAFPNLTNDEVRQRILNNAVDLGTAGFDNFYGYGRVDMERSSYSPQFTVTGINGGSNSVIDNGITPGDQFAEISGYRVTADQTPYRAYLDSIAFSIDGTVESADINSISLYADLNDDQMITASDDSLLGQAPFSSSVVLDNIGYSFNNSGINLILTADVDVNANPAHSMNVLLNDPQDVTAYFNVHPFSTHFPFYAQDISLPVELLTFDVQISGGKANISWQTASEINTAYYELFRNDGKSEKLIATINAAGNSSQQLNYSFTDKDIKPGVELTYHLYNVEITGYKEKIAEEKVNIPEISQAVLYPNYPNPFNPSTRIEYRLPANDLIGLKIYDALGRDIVTLANEMKAAGIHSVVWNGKNENGEQVGNGIYYYRLKTGSGYIKTRKMMLLR